MKHYLKEKIDYNGTLTTDIFKRYDIIKRLKEDGKFFFDYYIRNEYTPELVAHEVYGSADWWWLVLIYNDMIDPWFDWPLSNEELESYVKKLVPDWETNPSGYATRLSTEMTLNDAKKQIQLLRPEYLPIVIKNYYGIR